MLRKERERNKGKNGKKRMKDERKNPRKIKFLKKEKEQRTKTMGKKERINKQTRKK